MRNKFLLFVLSTAFSVSAWGERVSQDDAAVVANHFMNATPSAVSGAHKAPAKQLVLKKAPSATEEQQFYVYENADGEGWVMVAANNIAKPILAYSHEGYFRTDNQPDNVKYWLGNYNKQIIQAEKNGVKATKEVKQAWKALRRGTRKVNTIVVSPLIKTYWDQDAPYNNQCPKIGTERTVTGCVATAMAQVMNYWQWPETGTGSASVTVSGQTYTVDFSDGSYDWDNMLDKYSYYVKEGEEYATTAPDGTTTQRNAVAKLMYHCGVAVDMTYGVAGSSAQTTYPNANYTTAPCAQYALWKYFGYKKSTIKGYYRPGGYGYSAVSDANWLNLLKTELDAARPIMYGGSGDEGGHSFICDGYDDKDMFHFNWGWSGSCNGYYEIDALEPGTGGIGSGNGSYNEDQDIIIGIVPDKPDVTITWSVLGVTTTTTQTTGPLVLPANPSDCPGTGGKKFVGWTEQSTISGGTKPADLFTSGTGITITEAKTYYAVYATASTGGGGAFDGETEGSYKIYADVNGTKYYATGTGSKISSTTDATEATEYAFAKVTDGWSIKAGDNFITYSSSTNLGTSTSAYAWTLSDGSYGTWRVTSGNSARAWIYRAGTTNKFGGYAISNVNGTEYFDLEIGGGSGTTYSDYSLDCSVPTPPATTYTVTWKACGETFKTETYAEGDALVLPTPAPSANAGKNFYGWTTTEHYTGEAAPALISAGSEVNADATYYAVFH